MDRRTFLHTAILSPSLIWFAPKRLLATREDQGADALLDGFCREALDLLQRSVSSLRVINPDQERWVLGWEVTGPLKDTQSLEAMAHSLRDLVQSRYNCRWLDFRGRPEQWDFAHAAPTLWFQVQYTPRTKLAWWRRNLSEGPSVLLPRRQEWVCPDGRTLGVGRGLWHQEIMPLLGELSALPFARLGLYRVTMVPDAPELFLDYVTYRIPDPRK